MQTRLQAIRERRNLSRAQLAVKANVSERMIVNYESPATYARPARVNTMKAVAEALGVKMATIFDRTGRAR